MYARARGSAKGSLIKAPAVEFRDTYSYYIKKKLVYIAIAAPSVINLFLILSV